MKRWSFAAGVILLLAVGLRLHRLTLPPLHHDEGVNGFFMLKLFREGLYRYDPSNYHGPLLYYADLPLLRLLGVDTFALRLSTVLFGAGVIALILAGRVLSRRASLFAAALVAVSPGMVYFSRYFIHEMLVVFFTLATVVALCRYRDGRSRLSLLAAAAAAGFLFATKETALPTVIVLGLAALLSGALVRFFPARAGGAPEPTARGCVGWVTGLACVLVFSLVAVSLYTSCYKNPDGVRAMLTTFSFWTRTGTNQHLHPLWQYGAWLLTEEGALFILGCGGTVLALVRRRDSRAVFCAFWALGILAMYSLIPYKTPWLTVNMILPLALMAGYLVDEGITMAGAGIGGAGAAAAVAISLLQSVSLNFTHYDDNTRPYVYAHTVRDVDRLVRDVAAQVRARGKETEIAVVAEEYWPLPWLWRDYAGALFYGEMAPLDHVSLVVAQAGQEKEVLKESHGRLRKVGGYVLRPGVDLHLWADGATGAGMAEASAAGR